MVRVRAWDGAAWKDVRVWDGSSWRSYVPPVFGAWFFRDDFNAAGIPAGWTGGGGVDGTQYPISNWANVHLYVDTNAAWLYSPAGTLRAPTLGPFRIPPSVTSIRIQAGIHCAYISGPTPACSLTAEVLGTITINGASTAASCTAYATGIQTIGWQAITSDPVNVPYTEAGTIVQVGSARAQFIAAEGLYDPPGNVFRMYCDWFRIIDQGGNELYRESTPAVEPLKVWDGLAWK